MKNIYKTLLAVSVSVLLTVPAFSYPDVDDSHWAADQIKTLTEKGVVVGYPDGTFHPDENVTRAEFASMAIKALGQENTTVVQPVNFTDINEEFWAYDSIQKALYFDLIAAESGDGLFRPDDSVSRAEAITVAVNALTTEQISVEKAKGILAKKYGDLNKTPEWFIVPAGKAEILEMLITEPSSGKNIDAERPATRAEVTAILLEMTEQAKLNPNAKLAEVMSKKKGEGHVLENAYVQGSIGTIPTGTLIPIKPGIFLSTQSSASGELYTAKINENFITKDKYILIAKGAELKGQLTDVRSGKWFVRNGVLVIDNALITTVNDQTAKFSAVTELRKDRNWFMKFVRATLKGEKLESYPDQTLYLRLLQPVQVDLTNGWIIE